MLYSEPLFRPPAEAGSLIVQITEGCAYNRCLFCPMYKGKDFRVHSPAEIAAHLRDLAAAFGPDHTRVFLADGDALVMDIPALLAAMAQVRSDFPGVRRFSAYGSVFSLAGKTADDLLELKAAGLRTVYLGLESGDEETLRRMDKYMEAPRMAGICRRVVDSRPEPVADDRHRPGRPIALATSRRGLGPAGQRDRAQPHLAAQPAARPHAAGR